MNKIIYHGSTEIVVNPEKRKGKINNDYGQGFYCTYDIELAKEWAAKHNTICFVNEYELDLSNLKILNLIDKKYSVLNWLAILLQNRTFNITSPLSLKAKEFILEKYLIDTSSYDVIIGYRADDSYFAIAKSFLNNSLSLKSLEIALKLGDLGIQIALVSNEAFQKLTFKKSHDVDYEIYNIQFYLKDENARRVFLTEINNYELTADDLYISDIIKKENKK